MVDRLKDVIITGGENVSSREVEDVLSRHPGVVQVAVVGVPDEYWGEAICAVVTPAQIAPRRGDIVAYARAAAGRLQTSAPRGVRRRAADTRNGKIAKDVLRQRVRVQLER